MRISLLGSTAVLGVLCSSLTLAEEAAPVASAAAGQRAATTVNEILVTAQRRSERLQDVPLSITAHTGDTLRESGVTNIRDLALVVPGLSFTTNGTFAQPSIRGVHTTLSQAGSDSPVAIYLDGFYQPNQMGNVFDLPDVERIEVLKGPQGTLFGRNATGGAIVVHTLEPSYETTGRISLTDGVYFGSNAKTANEVRANAHVSGGIVDGKLAVGLSGYYSHTKGYMTDDLTGARTGRVENFMTRGKVLFEPTENVNFLLTGFYSKREDAAAAALFPLGGVSAARAFPDAQLPTRPWHVTGELDPQSPVETSQRGATLRSEFEFDGVGTLTSLTGYTVVKATTTSDTDAAYAPGCLATFACIMFDLGYGPNKTFQQEFSFASEQFGDFSFVAGAFIYRDKHNLTADLNAPIVDREIAGPGVYFSDSQVKTEAYAGFGEVNWNATDRLTVIGGLRYSWEEKALTGSILGGPEMDLGSPSWDSWTPRVSVRFDISDAANIYATYSKGFKSGVVDSVGVTTDVADPETLTSYEVGTKIGTGRFTLNASAFYYDYKDLQVQFFDGTRLLMANAADAEMYGLDLETSLAVTPELQLRGSASWLPRARYEDFAGAVDFALQPDNTLVQTIIDASGVRMMRAPKFTANLAAQYVTEIAGGEVQGDINLYYASKLNWNLLQRVQTKNYVTVNAQLSYAPADTGFRFSLWGKNIFNEDYITGAILSASSDAVVFAPPRQVGITVDYMF